ncbi:aromatic acid exporter family protein [Caproiciproducens sp. MSJ-32]|uniref:aromatic acid exporter family protein n=1 Tax=Caproiciproducens sp. MSJ-32 TaxID=2841527 RepID=UPI001C10D8EA|nr:aromatic acid exporter family protein [Caproiciproducens sp. MSJ-32]MBU5454830.1 aromatic acid exporter family protein [Caproiciproducens sp. MSJ-32]
MKYIDNLAVKMAVSAAIAFEIGNMLNVQFSAVAAVIAILSIQDTRKKSFEFAKKRIIACVISIILSFIVYNSVGQNFITFGIFLIIFIPITSKLNIIEGMVPASVLSTHLLLADKINLKWIINELLITFIAVGVASIANLFMPSYEKKFNEDKEYIEEGYKKILTKMSKSLITYTIDIDEGKLMRDIENRLHSALDNAYKIANNKFSKGSSYYVEYINMRITQFDIIKKLRSHFEKFYMSFEQTHMIAKLTKKVADQLHESNDCKELLKNVEILKEDFKIMALPKTREEFENRAQLLQFINDLEDLLKVKRNFVVNNENKSVKYK